MKNLIAAALAVALAYLPAASFAYDTTPTEPAGGDLTGSYPNPTLVPAGTAGTYGAVTTDAKGRITSGVVATPIANGGTGATTATAAQANLGLGSAATQNSTAFDAAGAATAAQSAVIAGSVPVPTAALTGSISVANGGTGSTTGSLYNLYGLPQVSPNGTYYAHGDSITFGTGASKKSLDYFLSIAADVGVFGSLQGIVGAQACDQSDLMFYRAYPINGQNGFTTIMVGTNDAWHNGAGAYENVYKGCLGAAISWATIPVSYKVFAPACTQTGTWAADAAHYTGVALSSTTNGSTLSCSITTYGKPLYQWFRQKDTYTGTFTYSVDDGTAVSVNSYSTPAMSTQNAGSASAGATYIRIPGLSAGSHTVLVTVTSATGATATVTIDGIGTVPPAGLIGGVPIYIGGVVREQNDAAAATTLAFNNDAAAVANQLLADGLNAHFVDTRSYVNVTTDMTDIYHPNDTGHAHLRDAFEAVIQTYLPVARYGQMDSTIYGSTAVGYQTLKIKRTERRTSTILPLATRLWVATV